MVPTDQCLTMQEDNRTTITTANTATHTIKVTAAATVNLACTAALNISILTTILLPRVMQHSLVERPMAEQAQLSPTMLPNPTQQVLTLSLVACPTLSDEHPPVLVNPNTAPMVLAKILPSPLDQVRLFKATDQAQRQIPWAANNKVASHILKAVNRRLVLDILSTADLEIKTTSILAMVGTDRTMLLLDMARLMVEAGQVSMAVVNTRSVASVTDLSSERAALR